MSNDGGFEIDQKSLAQIKLQILQAERNNLNTNEKTNDQMVDLLQNTIKRVVDKAY